MKWNTRSIGMDTSTDIVSGQTPFSTAEIQAVHAVPIHLPIQPAGKGPILDEALSNFATDHLLSCREIDQIAEILLIPSLLDTPQVRRAGYDLHVRDLMDGHFEAFPPPLIHAASNPDAHVLKSLLSLNRHDLSAEWEETSACTGLDMLCETGAYIRARKGFYSSKAYNVIPLPSSMHSKYNV